MAKKRKKLSPEVRAEWKAKSEEIERLLRERIAYHEAKMAQEREAGAG